MSSLSQYYNYNTQEDSTMHEEPYEMAVLYVMSLAVTPFSRISCKRDKSLLPLPALLTSRDRCTVRDDIGCMKQTAAHERASSISTKLAIIVIVIVIILLLYPKAHRGSCSKSLLAKVIRYIKDTNTSSVSNHYTYYIQSSATLGEVY